MFRTNHLIILGGPPCVGKTSLIQNIRQGGAVLPEQLGIANPALWLYVNASELPRLNQFLVKRLVLHYDFYTRYAPKQGFCYLDELPNQADNVLVLTLCASPQNLLQRNRNRLREAISSFFGRDKTYGKKVYDLYRLWQTQQFYRDGLNVFDLYSKWFQGCHTWGVMNHWLIDSNRPQMLRVHPYDPVKVKMMLSNVDNDSMLINGDCIAREDWDV